MPEAAIMERKTPPAWLVPLALVALIATASAWLDPWSAALAGDQKALFYDRLAVASAGSVTIAAGHLLIWAVLVILLKPMLSIALIVAVELWLVPEDSEKKNRLLVWTVQGLFLAISYVVALMLVRYVTLPEPLFTFAPAASPLLRGLQSAAHLLLWLLLTDFFQYWSHRAYHRFGFLWKFHAVHHAPRDLDALHKLVHPVEAAASWFLIAIPLGFLIGAFNASQFGFLTTFFLIQAYFAHTKAPIHFGPLGRVLVDNRYHFIHHSRERRHFDTNFAAIFPLWDQLFGTHSRPEGDTLPKTGLDDQLPPARLSHYLLAHLPADPVSASRRSGGAR